MNNVVPKNEFIKSWSDNGIGWVQLNHENKLNPLSCLLYTSDAADD